MSMRCKDVVSTILHVIYDQTHSSRLLLISALMLLCCNRGKCVVVKTSVGDDAVLPCEIDPNVDPSIDLADTTLEWNRPDLPPDEYVHYQRDTHEYVHNKNPSYMGRTSVFIEELKKGNMSLKLSPVRSSDEGIYTCFLPEFNTNFTVQLIVGNCVVVKTSVGDDAVLPCEIDPTDDPSIDPTETTLEWNRPDLPPDEYVHYQRDTHEYVHNKNPSYMGRTSVFIEELKKGNMSLKLSPVRSSDEGIYTCFLPEFNTNFTVQLIVGECGSDSDSGGDDGHFPWWGYLIITIIINIIIIISGLVFKRESILEFVHSPEEISSMKDVSAV